MSSAISESISERGKILIICDNYKFHFERLLLSGEARWRCNSKRCKSFLITVGEGNERAMSSGDLIHNHEKVSDRVLQRQHVSGLAKRKAVDDICDLPSKVISSVLSGNSENLQLSDLRLIRENLYKARRKLLPLPRDIQKVQKILERLKPETDRNEEFLLENNFNKNIVVFATKKNLQFLCKAKTLYMDISSNYCTGFFNQLFTIHGFFNGQYIPLVYCLLKNKSLATYRSCLQILLNQTIKNDLDLKPECVVIDFKTEIYSAIKCIWPNTKIMGCQFQLTQTWWKKIMQFGLSADYKDTNSEIGQWLSNCFGLMFFEPENVSDFFVFELSSIQPTCDNVKQFADYLVENYISDDAKFPPEMWAKNSASLNLYLTTNVFESYYSHINKCFDNNKPSIFIFLDALLKIQADVHVKMNDNTTCN